MVFLLSSEANILCLVEMAADTKLAKLEPSNAPFDGSRAGNPHKMLGNKVVKVAKQSPLLLDLENFERRLARILTAWYHPHTRESIIMMG